MTKDIKITRYLSSLNISLDPSNFTINDDLSVDVSKNVIINVNEIQVTKLKVKFREINGAFCLNDNYLETLENFPDTIRYGCDISNNNLKTLEHCPKFIGGNFLIGGNKLETFEYLPDYIGEDIFIGDIVKYIKDPYEWRYFLFKKIYGKLKGFESEPIVNIINKYLGKSELNHQAIDELITLGESWGFTYD